MEHKISLSNYQYKVKSFFQNLLQILQNSNYFYKHTLQNYLKAENKTFRDALNKIRQKLAQHYIENTKMDLGTISFLLGYKEPSSFFRAYKKWNKKTPKQSS